MLKKPVTICTVGLLVCLWALNAPAAAQDQKDPRCAALSEEASSELAAEQYGRMLRSAQDRMRLCPDPESAFLLGLAQANMVDSLTVSDPAEREQMRLSALRNLRVAAAGGGLKPVWNFTLHDWIVHLQSLGPSDAADPDPQAFEDEVEPTDASASSEDAEPLHVPSAPPPQPQPVFPWGPVLTGVVGVAALTTGVVLGLQASGARDRVHAAASRLGSGGSALGPQELSDAVSHTRALNDAANSKANWSAVFLVGGAAATVGSLVWYFAMPPKGKWRWAVLPAGLQASVNF